MTAQNSIFETTAEVTEKTRNRGSDHVILFQKTFRKFMHRRNLQVTDLGTR